MHREIPIHKPTTPTHLPAHEVAARKRRAALLDRPKPASPKPPKHQPGRKTWYAGI